MNDYVPLIQTALWVGLALIALVMFRGPLVNRIKGNGAIEIAGVIKLGERVRDVQRQVDDLSDKVSRQFLLTMSPAMYKNLKKLAFEEGFGEYEMGTGLTRELLHLRDVGYISVTEISSLPHEGPNLSSHVSVTPTGHQFIKLRKEIELA